ncbi:MAG: heparan-alpha-glucosaminide N-acetyltransferase domain-containing protein, partial [Bryobacteraceae bacterium]
MSRLIVEPVGQSARVAQAVVASSSPRQVSVDAFRGLTIAGMILVNNPGAKSSVYGPLQHASWHGWTPTDLVFPFFLFIMGVSCYYSFAGRMRLGESRRQIYLRIVRRTLILFALGLLISFAQSLELHGLRIPGVLQRIAVVYLCVSIIALNLGLRSQITIAAVCLLSYWGFMTLIPVPGYGPSDFTAPGNLTFYLDRLLLAGHFRGNGGDALGVLSTLPAIASALAG